MASDQIYEAAKKELSDLRARCREVEAFLERYERYAAEAAPREADAPAAGAAPRVASSAEIMSAVHDILEARGDALPLAAIFHQLLQRGIRIGGAHPKQNLSQKLSAESNLKSYGKRGWYFADALPPCLQVQSNPRALSPGQNEEGSDSDAAEPLQSVGSEDVISRSTSVPSGRDINGSAFVSSAPKPPTKERTQHGVASHR